MLFNILFEFFFALLRREQVFLWEYVFHVISI